MLLNTYFSLEGWRTPSLTSNKLVSREIDVGTGTEEDIRLIEKQHGVPQLAQIKSPVESRFDFLRPGSERARTYGVKWDASSFSN